MSRNIIEDYKAVGLLISTSRSTGVTGPNVAVETLGDNAMVVVDVGGGSAGFSCPVYVYGSLTGTSTAYDQLLATFTAITTVGIAAKSLNLNNIANINAAIAPAGSTTLNISVIALGRSLFKNSVVNNAVVG